MPATRITNEQIYKELQHLDKRLTAIEYAINGNGAIGILDQTRENAKAIKDLTMLIKDVDEDGKLRHYKFRDKVQKIIYASGGAVIVVSIIWEILRFLKK